VLCSGRILIGPEILMAQMLQAKVDCLRIANICDKVEGIQAY